MDKLGDVWASRDYPVLLAIAEVVDQGGNISVDQMAEKTGLSTEDCYLAARSLDVNGYLQSVSYTSGRHIRVTRISASAYRATGLHPDPADAASSLVHILEQAAEKTTDAAEKSKLQRAAGAVGEVGGTLLGTFLSAYAAKITGLG